MGTVSHWTRPFDWFLCGLNPLAAHFVPGAAGVEAAAVFAGPVLGVLAVLLFLWGAVRLLGRTAGLVAATFYSLQYPLLVMGAVGNGDHQNLQHLFLLAFGWLWLLDRAGRLRPAATPLAGVALGLGIWVSTESMVVLFTYVGVTALLLLIAPRDALPRRAATELRRCLPLLVVLGFGVWVEQGSFFSVQWDSPSWFQLYPVAVFTVFIVFVRVIPNRPGRAALAAAAGLGLGLLGLWLIPGLGAAVSRELTAFEDVNVWLQTCVSEFRSSFRDGTGYSLAAGLRRFTVFFVGLPVFLVAAGVTRDLPAPARLTLVVMTIVGFGIAAWEVKLSHVFAIWLPVAVVVGWRVICERLLPKAGSTATLAALTVGVIAVGWHGMPVMQGAKSKIETGNEAVRELCKFLRGTGGGEAASVLAPWSMGGPLMYLAKWPVVASGYHRNIDGIRDAYRVYCSQPEEDAEAKAILARRHVRFIVIYYSRVFLQDAQTVLGTDKVFLETTDTGSRFTELATRSLYWRLRHGGQVPGLRLRYSSEFQLRLTRDGPMQPMFQVFEVTR